MLMLAGLMGLMLAGLSVDMTSIGSTNEPEPDDEDFGGDTSGQGGEDLAPIMPDPDEFENNGGSGTNAPDVIADTAGTSDSGYAEAEGDSDSGSVSEENVADLNEILGGEFDDLLMGSEDADRIFGFGGGDDLRGGLGDDLIDGGNGDDWIQGDGVYGIGGNDTILGGDGADFLAGQGGNDSIEGGAGNDTVYGGEGDDTLLGGAGDDWISGNDGNDVLVSGGGADDLDGGRGDDLLIGHDDGETVWMHGGEGNDTLMPGSGDFAEGQAGADTFVLGGPKDVVPVIGDFNADEDLIELHFPEGYDGDGHVDLVEDRDGTTLIRVDGEPVGRLMTPGDLNPGDIRIVR